MSNYTAEALEARLASNITLRTEWRGHAGLVHIIESKSFALPGIGESEAEAVENFLWRNGLIWEQDE